MNDHIIEAAIATCIGVIVRCLISLYPYSGFEKPPLHGDFEAQRHWMEITVNLPVKDWYINSTDNDLQYWGLDYPPLTAYHSWLCGWLANRINTSWVELFDSRGIESSQHKLFMRYTVLAVDLMIYFPAVLTYFNTLQKERISSINGYLLVLLYPGLILIDHGHFQYNCVSLGLTLWAITFIANGHDLLGSIAFVLALNYKQMELYHAMPFFCFLLGSSFYGKENWFLKLTKIGLVVILTFVVCWYPFLQDKDLALQVLHRLFPFARGLYEDKVANFWCSISIIIKIKQLLSISAIIRLCLVTTLVFLVPSSLHLLLRPSVKRFKYALVNSSLVFFLFSFQVHEKSILIVALPVCLLIQDHPKACQWFLFISTFSMFPLLIKDGLVPAYAALSIFYMMLTSLVSTQESQQSPSFRKAKTNEKPQGRQVNTESIINITWALSVLGAIALCVASLTVTPPKNLPDLYPVLISVYSCGHFLSFLLFFHWKQFTSCDKSERIRPEAQDLKRKPIHSRTTLKQKKVQ